MSWLYSLALVEEYSERVSLDTSAFVPLKTNHTHRGFYSHGKTTKHSNHSRYGTMLQHLTEQNGEELLIISGGFPCQDISIAGKQTGLHGERSGLWGEMARIVEEIQPTVVFIENSPQLAKLGLDKVLFDIAEMGYDAEWGIFGAEAVGSNHLRQRMWVLGVDTNKIDALRETESTGRGAYKDFTKWSPKKVEQEWFGREFELDAVPLVDGDYAYSEALRILDGLPDRMDRLARLGNAQVPAVATLAYLSLWNRLMSK